MNNAIYGVKPTRHIIVNVSMDDDFSEVSIYLLVHLNDNLMESIVMGQKLIADTKDSLLDIYHITLWDNIGKYIPTDVVNEFDNETGEYFDESKDFSYISEETYNSLLKIAENHQLIRTEGTTIEIHDTVIRFNGSIKYGSSFTSSSITLP